MSEVARPAALVQVAGQGLRARGCFRAVVPGPGRGGLELHTAHGEPEFTLPAAGSWVPGVWARQGTKGRGER